MEELFNKITSNGCREMTEARFSEALKEYKRSILTLVDKRIETAINEINSGQSDNDDFADAYLIEQLTELKQKIEAL